LAHARFVSDLTLPLDYSPWRHGGWYVGNVRYPNGAVGCVSRNYPDKRWRIACDGRPGDYTYRTRDAAARAEQVLALSQYTDQCIAEEMDRANATRASIEAKRHAAAGTSAP
jgi:hypothetical protein